MSIDSPTRSQHTPSPSYWRSAFLFIAEATIMMIPFAFVGGVLLALLGVSHAIELAYGFVLAMLAFYFFFLGRTQKGPLFLRIAAVAPVGFYIRSGASLILDFITAFFAFGYPIGIATDQMDGPVFRIQDEWTFVVVAGIAAYFVIGNGLLGGTLWRHILNVATDRT